MKINVYLKNYIEKEILKEYEKNEKAHSLEHINYVIRRSLEFAKQFPDINLDMVYTIASFHDIGHHIDKDNHEVISAKIFYNDLKMKEFFSEEERITIKEAIIDHRASLKGEPRSIYGKIVSSADRGTNIIVTLKRTHSYSLKHYPNFRLQKIIDRAYNHINQKYGKEGYAKIYIKDLEYDKFRTDLNNILNDKNEFIKLYLKANDISILEYAKEFAIIAHNGQVRKNEKEKPMIIHPINCGNILKEYGFDENVIAAAYLHDVVEDTKYTIDDIKNLFGDDIASLVNGASEPSKKLSWEERKKHTIENIKKLDLRHKAVVCADKISNLEDLRCKSKISEKLDFSSFKKGFDAQKWYYENIYQSLVYKMDENYPMFRRLKEIIKDIFTLEEDNFIKEKIFEDNEEYLILEKLHYKKLELYKLKSVSTKIKPYVIEFTGTPRTGKTTLINNLYDFFKKASFNVCLLEEFTTSKKYQEEIKPLLKDKYKFFVNTEIPKYVMKQLNSAIEDNPDIILIDRSLVDRMIWIDRLYNKQGMTDKEYQDYLDNYIPIIKDKINTVIATTTDSLTSLKRDYKANLSLEARRFLNIENIDEYNNALNHVEEICQNHKINFKRFDTTNLSIRQTSFDVANKILDDIRLLYIKEVQNEFKTVE